MFAPCRAVGVVLVNIGGMVACIRKQEEYNAGNLPPWPFGWSIIASEIFELVVSGNALRRGSGQASSICHFSVYTFHVGHSLRVLGLFILRQCTEQCAVHDALR